MMVFIDKNQLAATITASAFALIGPDACYAGSMLRLKSVCPKLYFRKICSCCV